MNDVTISDGAYSKAHELIANARAVAALLKYAANEAESSEVCRAAELVESMLREAHDSLVLT